MKISFSSTDLGNCLKVNTQVVSDKTTNPMTAMVKLIAEGDKMTIVSTDLETQVVTKMDANVIESGEVCVDASILAKTIGVIKADSEVMFEESELNVKITTGKKKFTMMAVSSDTFPEVADVETNAKVTANIKDLVAVIKKSGFCRKKDDRIWTEATYLEVAEGKFNVITCDMVRLFSSFVGECETDMSALISPKAINVVKNSLGLGGETEVSISCSNTDVVFETECLQISNRQLEVKYPPYRAIIPKNATESIIVDKNEFLDALKSAQIYSNEAGTVVLSFDHNAKVMSIEAEDLSTQKKAVQTIDYTYETQPTIPSVKFFGKGLEECVSSFDTDYLQINMTLVRPTALMFGGTLTSEGVFEKDDKQFVLACSIL